MPATTCRRIRPELWAAGLLFAAFLGLFSGCGPSEADATASEAVQESSPGFVRSQPQLTRWTPEAPDLTPLTVQAEGEPAGQAPIKNAAKEDARADAPGAAKAPPNRTTRAGPPHTGATATRTAREPVRWTPRLAGPRSTGPGRAAERVTEPPEAADAAPEGGESRAAAGQDITLPHGARGRAPILPGDTLVRVTRADERVRTRVDARVAADRPEAPRGAVSARPERATPRAVGEGRVARSTARLSHPMLGKREIELGDDLSRLMPRSAVSPRAAVAGDDPNEWRTGRGWAPGGEDDDRGDYLSSAEEFEVLVPGSGWSGSTQQPPPVGNDSMPGFDAKAIARWDVVPFQTITEDFHIGVVAFHINGIDRVEFSVNGGPWSRVPRMQLNPRTNVWEYTVVIRPDLFEEDGLVEVRAIAWPKSAGVPRVLAGRIDRINDDPTRTGAQSLFLNSNSGRTFGRSGVYVSASRGDDATGDGTFPNPFRTIYRGMKVDGATSIDGLDILLEPGTYAFDGSVWPYPTTRHGWATIRPAPGVAQREVILTGGRIKVKHVAIRDVTLDLTDGLSLGIYPALDPYLWIDNVIALGPGGTDRTMVVRRTGAVGMYITSSRFSDFADGAQAMSINRNVHLHNLGSDAFGDSELVINCSVDGIQVPHGTDWHPDVYQFSGTGGSRDNTIVYGLAAWNVGAQGIFADDLERIDNVAFVNVFIRGNADGAKSQWKDVHTSHLLLWHVGLVNQPLHGGTGVCVTFRSSDHCGRKSRAR
jgi:hypothetical protein